MSTPNQLSATPRTDRAWAKTFQDDEDQCRAGNAATDMRDACATLERELATLTADRDELRAELAELHTSFAGNVHTRCNQLAAELATERDKAERYRLAMLKLDAQLAEWSVLNLWGGTPEIIHEFVKGQQERIHHCQDIEAELAAERARLERITTALTDAISTYFGADKLVTAERIEAWQAALKEEAKSP
jgi:chromosome segregation ATPase